MTLRSAFGQVKLTIASVTVWWIVYTCCEVVFVHLHHFPRALLWTALLYLAEGQWSSCEGWHISGSRVADRRGH